MSNSMRPRAPGSPRRSNRGRIALRWLAALAVLLVAVALWLHGSGAKMATPSTLESGFAVVLGSLASSPNQAPSQDEDGAMAADAGDDHGGDIEVCGVGWVKAKDDRSPDLGPELIARARSARRDFVYALPSAGDERTRALQLFLQQSLEAHDAAERKSEAIENACGADRQCVSRAAGSEEFRRSDWTASTERLARDAASTRDPLVYAVALQACGSGNGYRTPAPSCSLLSFAQWAALDGDNAVPWLHVAAAAAARNDKSAVDEAIYRAAISRNDDNHGAALLALAVAAIPAGTDPFAAGEIGLFVLGVWTGWSLPPYQVATQYCNATALGDANRRQTCDGLARLFVERSSNLIERRIGSRLGERLGWAADRLASLREESDGLQRALSEQIGANRGSSCEAVQRTRDFLGRIAGADELGAARAAVTTSGKTLATLAEEERAARNAAVADREARAAAAQAAPASAPERLVTQYFAGPPPVR